MNSTQNDHSTIDKTVSVSPQAPEAACSVRLSERDEAKVMATADEPPAPNEAAVQAAKRFLNRHG